MSPRVIRFVVAGAAALAVAVAVRGGMQPLGEGALIVSAPAFLIAVGMADVLGAWRQSLPR
jgi:hypothetical protein